MQTELASMSASARLDELSIRDFVMDDDLNPGEQAELDRLQAWSETLAPHLTTSGDPETDELRRLLRIAVPLRRRASAATTILASPEGTWRASTRRSRRCPSRWTTTATMDRTDLDLLTDS
jgi:hypothetical protein